MKVQEFIKTLKPLLVKDISGRTSVLFKSQNSSKYVPIEKVDEVRINYDLAKERHVVMFIEGNYTTICDLNELIQEDQADLVDFYY